MRFWISNHKCPYICQGCSLGFLSFLATQASGTAHRFILSWYLFLTSRNDAVCLPPSLCLALCFYLLILNIVLPSHSIVFLHIPGVRSLSSEILLNLCFLASSQVSWLHTGCCSSHFSPLRCNKCLPFLDIPITCLLVQHFLRWNWR